MMPKVRGMRTVKKEILKLIDTYVQKADDVEMINGTMVPPLLDAVLVDYSRNLPDARDAEVLNVISTIISKLHVRCTPHATRLVAGSRPPPSVAHTPISLTWRQGLMEDKVPMIMENVFECTLMMINKDFSEYPEHRVAFFKLLRAINFHCFPGELHLHLHAGRASASLTIP